GGWGPSSAAHEAVGKAIYRTLLAKARSTICFVIVLLLENQFKPELQITLATLGSNQSEIAGSWIRTRIAEQRMVREVECFESQLRAEGLNDPEILEQRRVPAVESRPAKNVESGVSEGALRGNCESRWVEPQFPNARRSADRSAAHHIPRLRCA